MSAHEEHYCELHEWKTIGMVSTSCAMLAIVDARGGDGVEPAMEALWQDVVHKRHRVWPNFESFKGPGKHGIPGLATGLFVATPSNGGYDVEARFCDLYGDGHMSICELRIRLHDHSDDEDEEPPAT